MPMPIVNTGSTLCISPFAGVRTDREMNFENEYKNDCRIAVANHII